MKNVSKKKVSGVVDANTLMTGNVSSRRVTHVTNVWCCEYCGQEMQREANFMKHRCTQMERAQDIRSVDGQAAYQYYTEWFKVLKRKAPQIETFMHSRNYNAFRKLVDFFRRINLASSSNYIRFMADNDISPVLWCRDQSYSMYLTFLDSQYDPLEAVRDTVSFLKKEANQSEITASELLAAMTLKDMAVLTQRRLISPYFLIFSSNFRTILQSSSDDERTEFIKCAPLQFWAQKLHNDPSMTENIRAFVKSENI